MSSTEIKHNTSHTATKHKTITPYQPRLNGQTERFVGNFKRLSRKTNKEVIDKVALQQYVRVYGVILNPITTSGHSPLDMVPVRKVKSGFIICYLPSGNKKKCQERQSNLCFQNL